MENFSAVGTVERGFDQDQRFYDDKTTWLAEVLNGQMRTSFEYTFDGQELYSRDGSALSPIFKTAISDAEKLTAKNPHLSFERRRRYIEWEELNCMYAMARDALPNTMVVISDFPPELMSATRDVGGYNASRKQTMMRVITKTEDGKIVMRSQSLDGSNRQALEAIYKSLGYIPQAGELLGQRIHLELDAEDQEFLSDILTGIYDRSMEQQFGGEWYAGRKPVDLTNTYDFVLAQKDLLEAFKNLHDQGESSSINLYNLAAAMQLRLDRYRSENGIDFTAFVQADMMKLMAEMSGSGAEARKLGVTFSGCGETLTAENEMKEAGYGNKSEEKELKYEFSKKMYCLECQAPPKEGEPMKMCGPCGFCRSCDTAIRERNAAKWN